MKIDIKQIAMTAGAVALGVVLFRFIKHEYAEMKAEKDKRNTPPAPAGEQSIFERFQNYPKQFWNYVDEGFMGFTASDEFMMLGGSKPIEFANAAGHKIPVATDEPNFAYASGQRKKIDRKG
jgi:hypothetical protein